MALDLLSGLAQGFVQGQQARLAQEEKREQRKLKEKLFKRQLDMLEEQDLAKQKLFQLLSPALQQIPAADDEPAGQVKLPGKSLLDVLSDPEGQMLALQSGMMKPTDIKSFQQPNIMQLLQQFTGQPGGQPGGMELTGIKIGPDNQIMPDLARPKFKTEVPSPDGMSMIRIDEFGREMGRRPIGPGERKDDPKSKARLSVTNAKQRADRVSKLIDDAVERVGMFTTGAVGMPLSMLPGTPARNLKADIDTIKANIGFDELNAMRQASPTGGALGQVSERELGFLQSVLANLEQSQSPAQLKRNLLKAKEEIRQSWERVMEAYEQDFGNVPGENNKPSLKGPGKQNKVVDFNDLP